MAEFGVTIEGAPHYPLRTLDSGYTIPDVPLSTIRQRERKSVRDMVDLAVTSEELGYDYVYTSEHHFGLWGGNSPHPIQIQTAMATQTDEIRLVQLANILPWHHPIRIAEQTAVLDVLSDGRVEVGIGTGYGDREAAVFGSRWGGDNGSEKKEMVFNEAFQALKLAWTDEAISMQGEFYSLPPRYTHHQDPLEFQFLSESATEYDPEDFYTRYRGEPVSNKISVFPKPAQQPHPQLWRPITSGSAAQWAAAHGVNGCCICVDFERTSQLIEAYHRTAEKAGWPDHRPDWDGEAFSRGWDADRGRGIVPRVSVFNTEIADAETYEGWKKGHEFSRSMQEADGVPGAQDPVDIDVERELAARDAPIVGDTDHIISELRRLIDVCEFEDVNFNLHFENIGISHEERVEQLESFAQDVLPVLE